MSRFLVVEMHEDLDNLPGIPQRTTRTSVFRGILLVPGVKMVTDVSIISQDTLTAWLLPAEQSLLELRLKQSPKPKKAR